MSSTPNSDHSPAKPELCAMNCGYFGNPATMNLCSKCFKAAQASTETTTTAATKTTIISNSSSSAAPCSSSTTLLVGDVAPRKPAAATISDEAGARDPPKPGNRCKSCRRKLGLLGFVCKCGDTFCGTHRYPEKHECEVDYKGAGRDAIEKANPLVKADKITRF